VVKRHTTRRSGFFPFWSALFVPTRLASGRVSRLDSHMPAQTARGCATYVLQRERRRDDGGKETP
jgi:hypothetical protein